MQELFTTIFDFIFPPSEAEKTLRDFSNNSLRTLLDPGVFNGIEYLCPYHQPVVKTAVLENKFRYNRTAATLLGKLIAQRLKHQPTETIYIPIPLGKKRYRTRGHNQVNTILINTPLDIKINTSLLKRVIETAPQSSLNKKSRSSNIQSAFLCCKESGLISDSANIVLIDDVVTTGSTLLAAKIELARSLPSSVTISCLAIAH